MLAAGVVFSCCTFALKLIPADTFDIMVVRFLVQTVIFGIYGNFYKHYNLFSTNGQPLACSLNIVMSCITNLTYFSALYFLPLSDLNTIKYTDIVWASLLSVIFLKDHFKIVNGVAIILTFSGLILATKPHLFIEAITRTFNLSPIILPNTTISNITTTIDTTATASPYYYLGVGLACVTALAKAIQMIARKKLITTKQPYSVMNFQFTTGGLVMSVTYSIVRRFWQPGPYPWKWMGTAGVIIGFCQLLSNTFVSKALKRENVQLLTILGSLDIVYAVILQYIFFRQTKTWIFYIGALLIVLSAVILSVDRHLTNKREKQNKANNHKIEDVDNNV